MHETYEYIFSGVVVLIMVTVTIATIFPIALTHVGQANAYQLQSSAQTILDKILLTSGYPGTWGTDLNINSTATANLKSFGLGGQGEYGTIYTVDPDEMERLVNSSALDNPYYIPASTAAKIMGVDQKYGFSLRLKPVFTMTSTANLAAKTITVTTRTPETVPVTNVNITGLLVRRNPSDQENAEIREAITDWNGTAVLDFSSANQFQKGAYILLANYYGITTATVGSFGSVYNASLIGNKLIVHFPGLSSATITQIISKSRDPIYISGNKTIQGSYSQPAYTLTSNGKTYVVYTLNKIDENVNAVVFISTQKIAGEAPVISAFRPPPLTYETGPLSGVHRYTITRLVSISGVIFRVEFHLWRLAE